MNRDLVLSSIFMALFLFSSQQVMGQTKSSVDTVRSTASQVIERLKSDREKINSDPQYIYALMDELVTPHFDFVTMSRAVLGSVWRDATSEQQTAFLDEFKALLIDSYASNLTEYSDNEIVYYPEESNPESRFVLVRTEVKGAINNKSLPIHYRMHQVNGKWLVVDVVVDSVSLISTYRGSFRSEINKDGLDSLIVKLADRNNRI